jgi:hypothetical protein
MSKRQTKVLSRAAFLNNLKRERVEIPDMGGAVILREMTAKQKIDYNDHLNQIKDARGENAELTPSDSIDLMALMISMTACDEDGALLFTAEDVQALAENSPSILLDLSIKAMELSGLGSTAIDEVKAEIKKAAGGDSVSN